MASGVPLSRTMPHDDNKDWLSIYVAVHIQTTFTELKNTKDETFGPTLPRLIRGFCDNETDLYHVYTLLCLIVEQKQVAVQTTFVSHETVDHDAYHWLFLGLLAILHIPRDNKGHEHEDAIRGILNTAEASKELKKPVDGNMVTHLNKKANEMYHDHHLESVAARAKTVVIKSVEDRFKAWAKNEQAKRRQKAAQKAAEEIINGIQH